MAKIVVRRVLLAVPMIFLVSFLSFALVTLAPGDAARTIAGPTATVDQMEQIRSDLGLDDPVLVQYGRWLSGAIQGDFGTSLQNGAPVSTLLNDRIAPTLSLIAASTLFAVLVGVYLGVVSAIGRPLTGRVVDVFALVGYAIPSFWLALLLVSWFAVSLGWFPATGYVSFSDGPLDWFRSLVLPVVAVSLSGVAALAKQTRDSMLDALGSDFVRVQQANGLRRRSIVWRHALRNAAGPIVAVTGVTAASLLSASVLVETVFALPGLGSGAATAAVQRDLPVVQGAVVYFTVFVLAIGLLADVVSASLDPKLRAQ